MHKVSEADRVLALLSSSSYLNRVSILGKLVGQLVEDYLIVTGHSSFLKMYIRTNTRGQPCSSLSIACEK
jgi:hypothetical protein